MKRPENDHAVFCEFQVSRFSANFRSVVFLRILGRSFFGRFDRKTTTRFSANFMPFETNEKRPRAFCEFQVGRFWVVSTEKRPCALLRILGSSKRTKNEHALFCKFYVCRSERKTTTHFPANLGPAFHPYNEHAFLWEFWIGRFIAS